MSANFIVEAEVRTGSGTAASRRARRNGQVPVVVYGGGEDEQYLLVDHNKIMLQLAVESFHSALVQLQVGEEDLQRAILRDVQMHPFKAQVLHLDFQRVSRTDTITMTVPFHFVGEEEAPGVKSDDGIMSHSMTSVDITCLGSDLPEYIEVDMATAEIGDVFHISDIILPAGVESIELSHGEEHDLAIANVAQPKGGSEEEDEAAEAAERLEAAGGAPAEDGKDDKDDKDGKDDKES